VVGPPHRGQFFAFPDPDRDSKWWMGFNLSSWRLVDDGISAPLKSLATLATAVRADLETMAATVLPEVVS
jgi:hypothetical protein